MKVKFPIKSTERNICNDTKDIGKVEPDIPIENNKTKKFCRIILVIFAIVFGTAFCTTVIYFAFLNKDEDTNNNISNRGVYNSNSNLI